MENIQINHLGLQSYDSVWVNMRTYTDTRDASTPDALWFVEHAAIYTQGQAGKAEHILNPGDIPVVQTDRGGQVTYHGPGQLVVYFLIDLKRKNLSVRDLVCHIEQAVIDMLAAEGVNAARRDAAPGVYIDGAKIASVGLRVRKGCSYHGLALNVNMDLSPFSRINPCGYQGLSMTQTSAHTALVDLETAKEALTPYLLRHLGYNGATFTHEACRR